MAAQAIPIPQGASIADEVVPIPQGASVEGGTETAGLPVREIGAAHPSLMSEAGTFAHTHGPGTGKTWAQVGSDAEQYGKMLAGGAQLLMAGDLLPALSIPKAAAAAAGKVGEFATEHPMLTKMAASGAVNAARRIPYVGKFVPPGAELVPFLMGGGAGAKAAEAAEKGASAIGEDAAKIVTPAQDAAERQALLRAGAPSTVRPGTAQAAGYLHAAGGEGAAAAARPPIDITEFESSPKDWNERWGKYVGRTNEARQEIKAAMGPSETEPSKAVGGQLAQRIADRRSFERAVSEGIKKALKDTGYDAMNLTPEQRTEILERSQEYAQSRMASRRATVETVEGAAK